MTTPVRPVPLRLAQQPLGLLQLDRHPRSLRLLQPAGQPENFSLSSSQHWSFPSLSRHRRSKIGGVSIAYLVLSHSMVPKTPFIWLYRRNFSLTASSSSR
ncbi:unnamed protein product [Cochlearia groenlandica]